MILKHHKHYLLITFRYAYFLQEMKILMNSCEKSRQQKVK